MIIPNGFASVQVPLLSTALTRLAYITFGVRNDELGSDPNVLANGVQTAMQGAGSFLSRLDNGVTAGPTEVALGTAAPDPLLGVANFTVTGTRSVSSPSPNVAVLVRKLTALGGRMNRGRFFIPWYADESALDEGGRLSTLERQATQDALTVFLAALTTTELPMVVLHATSLSTPPIVTALSVDGLVATQRRRLGRS